MGFSSHLYRSIHRRACSAPILEPLRDQPWLSREKNRETLGLEGGVCRYLREIEEGRLIYSGTPPRTPFLLLLLLNFVKLLAPSFRRAPSPITHSPPPTYLPKCIPLCPLPLRGRSARSNNARRGSQFPGALGNSCSAKKCSNRGGFYRSRIKQSPCLQLLVTDSQFFVSGM